MPPAVSEGDVGGAGSGGRRTKVGLVIGSADAEGASEALGEGGLPRPEVADQEDQVPGEAMVGEHLGEGLRLVGSLALHRSGAVAPPGFAHSPHPSSCLARMRSARIWATTTPPDRSAAEGW